MGSCNIFYIFPGTDTISQQKINKINRVSKSPSPIRIFGRCQIPTRPSHCQAGPARTKNRGCIKPDMEKYIQQPINTFFASDQGCDCHLIRQTALGPLFICKIVSNFQRVLQWFGKWWHVQIGSGGCWSGSWPKKSRPVFWQNPNWFSETCDMAIPEKDAWCTVMGASCGVSSYLTRRIYISSEMVDSCVIQKLHGIWYWYEMSVQVLSKLTS